MRLGVALHKVDLLDEAIVHCRRVLELDPAAAAAHNTLASCYQLLGHPDEAVRAFREAVRLAPEGAVAAQQPVVCAQLPARSLRGRGLCGAPAMGRTPCRSVDRGRVRVSPPCQSPAAAARLRLGAFQGSRGQFLCRANPGRARPRAVRGVLLLNALRTDETTERLRGHADQWREISNLDDEAAAQAVREDEIDVLVDLDGHIGGNRLTMFARRPAPVQATYIGYQNTTGMAAMDYRITDDWSDPPGETESLHTEQLVRLPDSFFCYRPSVERRPSRTYRR